MGYLVIGVLAAMAGLLVLPLLWEAYLAYLSWLDPILDRVMRSLGQEPPERRP